MSELNANQSRRRCDRLRRDADFSRLRTDGQAWTTPLLVVRTAPATGETVRFGIIASKRLGNAVRRNRVRRLVREALRSLCPRLRRGWDLVVIARSRMVEASAGQVEIALEDVLTRAGLIADPLVEGHMPTDGPALF